jgi:ketosteroid isomerase-like protein
VTGVETPFRNTFSLNPGRYKEYETTKLKISNEQGEKIMTTRLFIFVVLVLGIAACTTPATQPLATLPLPTTPPTEVTPTQPPVKPTPTPNPNKEIVLNMIERLNAGDVEGSLAYFADDAMVYLMGFPPTGIEVYAGKEQIRMLWEDSVLNHFQWEVTMPMSNGDNVNVQTKTWHDFTREIGVAPLEYSDVYEVKDGKIVTYGSWLTEESLARFKLAFAAVMPPEPTALPPSDPPVSEMAVTIANGSCTTDDPPALKGGEVTVTLDVQDQENSLYALTLFNLDEGKDVLDLMISTIGGPPSWLDILLLAELEPGKHAIYTFNVEKGPVYLVCWSKPPDMSIGNAGPFVVVP